MALIIRSIFKQILISAGLFFFCYGCVTFFQIYTPLKNSNNSKLTEDHFLPKTKDEVNPVDVSIETNKSKAGIRVILADQVNTRFTDVAGLKEAKDEVQDIISFLQNPEAFGRLGAKAPKGVLLYGEPGTGKTLLARAMAGEAHVNFIAVSGSEFDEEYVGVGAARVRQLFDTAREKAPCIIFIDEMDALAHKRHAHDPAWAAQTINQLLAEMDGLDDIRNNGIVIIGASNRIDAMDPAVLRPGRLDRHIKLDIPSLSERQEVINVYLNKLTNHSVNAATIAKMTAGFSSADLANLVNEATIIATKKNKQSVDISDFDQAKDRVILGSKREALKISHKTRLTTAYHEAGHAIVGHLLNANNNPIYKVTITPRGPTLGHTSFEPSDEEYSLNLQQIEALIATQLAGRIAEEIIFGEQKITTGAENDLQQATKLAYNMVTRWGYSKRVGPIHYNESMNFIPKEIIEQEVQAIIQRNYARAKKILLSNTSKLHRLSKALLEHETLDAQEIKKILN